MDTLSIWRISLQIRSIWTLFQVWNFLFNYNMLRNFEYKPSPSQYFAYSQGMQAVSEYWFSRDWYVPTGQGFGSLASSGQKCPAGQTLQMNVGLDLKILLISKSYEPGQSWSLQIFNSDASPTSQPDWPTVPFLQTLERLVTPSPHVAEHEDQSDHMLQTEPLDY